MFFGVFALFLFSYSQFSLFIFPKLKLFGADSIIVYWIKMSAIFNFHMVFQRVEFQASLGLENRFCLTSSINQRAVKGKILRFVHEVRWSYILDKSAPEPPTAVLLQGILGSRKNWDRKTVEDVLRGVHINFLKAERSLHRWASEDTQRIHVAEEQAVESKCMCLKMLVIGYVALHPNIPSP